MYQKERILEHLRGHNGLTRQEIAKDLGIRETSVDRAMYDLIREDVCVQVGGKKNEATATPARLIYIVTPFMKDRPPKNWFHLRREDEDGKLFLMCQYHEGWLRGRLKTGEGLFQIGNGTTGTPLCHYCEKSVDG